MILSCDKTTQSTAHPLIFHLQPQGQKHLAGTLHSLEANIFYFCRWKACFQEFDQSAQRRKVDKKFHTKIVKASQTKCSISVSMSSFVIAAFIAYILNFLQCQQEENNHLHSWSLNPSSSQTPFIYPGQTHEVSAFSIFELACHKHPVECQAGGEHGVAYHTACGATASHQSTALRTTTTRACKASFEGGNLSLILTAQMGTLLCQSATVPRTNPEQVCWMSN